MAFRANWKKEPPTVSKTLDLSDENRQINEEVEWRFGGEGAARGMKQQTESREKYDLPKSAIETLRK